MYDAHGSYYMAIVYIHYILFPSLQFNSRKINKRREELGLLYGHQQAETLNKP
jgi:hypothetical protein